MWFNSIIEWLLRSPLHGFVSKNMMLITFTGRKSGKVYTTPVNYIRNGDVLTTTSYKNRSWWRNLRGGAEVTLRIQGQDSKALAQVTEANEEVAAILLDVLRAAPQIARFYDVGLNADGQPNPENVREKAQKAVVITSRLQHKEGNL